MKKLLVVFPLFAAGVFGQNVAESKVSAIDGFAFMKGCWEIARPERKIQIVEQWMAPSGNTMIGMSRTVRGGKTTGWEYMRIEVSDTGVFFVSKPKENKEETLFRFEPSTTNEAAFENPDHDFPQRVIYRANGSDTLNARIEGKQNGKSSGVDFPYKRVKCD
jgi:Domain of unknown function (DUF6265)